MRLRGLCFQSFRSLIEGPVSLGGISGPGPRSDNRPDEESVAGSLDRLNAIRCLRMLVSFLFPARFWRKKHSYAQVVLVLGSIL